MSARKSAGLSAFAIGSAVVGWVAFSVALARGDHFNKADPLSGLLLLLWAYVGWLYVSRSRLLPSLLRIGLIASIAFIVVEAFVLKTVLSTARVFSAGTAEQLAVYAVFAAVFFPYAFYSQRMRETFVN